jgi:hypothetical protein
MKTKKAAQKYTFSLQEKSRLKLMNKNFEPDFDNMVSIIYKDRTKDIMTIF